MSAAPPAPDSTLVLKDGSTVAVRPVEAHDEAALTSFYGGLSPSSLAFRFFAAPQDVAAVAKRLVISNYESQFGLVALGAFALPVLVAFFAGLFGMFYSWQESKRYTL